MASRKGRPATVDHQDYVERRLLDSLPPLEAYQAARDALAASKGRKAPRQSIGAQRNACSRLEAHPEVRARMVLLIATQVRALGLTRHRQVVLALPVSHAARALVAACGDGGSEHRGLAKALRIRRRKGEDDLDYQARLEDAAVAVAIASEAAVQAPEAWADVLDKDSEAHAWLVDTAKDMGHQWLVKDVLPHARRLEVQR